MSTPEDASARTGSQIENGTISTTPALPVFAPLREPIERRISNAESSTTGSRRSALDFQKRSRSSLRDSLSFRGSEQQDTEDVSPTSLRRLRNRTSGGFLLDSATKLSRTSNSLLARSQREIKGKRRSEESEISLPKRRNRTSILDHDMSIGSSPLAMEVRQDDDAQSSSKAESRQDETYTNNVGAGAGENSRATQANTQKHAVPAVGYDTDPAQIVDMALRLSEGRRRYASSKRYVSGDVAGRRVVSTASTNFVRAVTPTKSLGQYLSSSQANSPNQGDRIPKNGDTKSIEDEQETSPYGGVDKDTIKVLEISRATAIRVEKARTYLELAYEHRRLISHLPPIRRPVDISVSGFVEPQSRVYNPLQYVRNRKLRLREKSSINGENTGWHDVDKVRGWVDTVLASHTETKHDPLECVRLPHLSKEVNNSDPENSQNNLLLTNQPSVKPRRPKSDWVTHPGDIIADAHWLEQGLNKTKIQDRDNNPIYPPDTQFKFSGWRNRTPIHVPDGLQEPTPPPEDDSLGPFETPLLEDAPALPTFRSSYQKKNKKDKKQKVGPKKLRKSLAKDARNIRAKGISRAEDSGSESDAASSIDTEDGREQRGRKRSTANREKFNLANGDPFGPAADSKRGDGRAERPTNASDPNLSAHSSKKHSIDHNKLINYLKRSSINRGSFSDREGMPKLERPRSERNARSSFEYDSTAPTSPITEKWPSIAINLSPPHSRSPSPTKRGKTSMLHSLLDKRRSQSRDQIDTTDFAFPSTRSHSREASEEHDTQRDSSNQRSRGTSPRTRGPSPLTKLSRASTVQDDYSTTPLPTPLEQRTSTMSRISTKSGTHAGDHSRIRGIFKGGRIAELVGNEVTRVGDFIWKKEPPLAAGINAEPYGDSDTDEEPSQNDILFKTPTRDWRSSTSTHSSPKESRLSQDSSKAGETPTYYNPNLPSFTSPFQRDRERQDQKRELLSPDSAMSGDHISQAAAEHRSRSKSPRMDRLAPPKLTITNTRSTSTDPRRSSYGFGVALGLTKPRTASQTYNDAINGNNDYIGSRSGSIADFSQQLRESVANISRPKKDTISKQDVCRIETLLLMSAVKAKGLFAIQDAMLPKPSKSLTDTSETDDLNKIGSSRIRRRDEHVLAARNLISALNEQSSRMNDSLSSFSNQTATNLQTELQVFEDRLENELTPRVRAAADNAGELSQKLTTTSTMAIKSVNDTISEAFRMKQRGPFRWFRGLGYGAIEWAVVGLLWLIWFVVTTIRFVLGAVKGTVKFGRWLLWLN